MPEKTTGLVRETERGEEIRCPWCGEWQPREEYKQYTVMPQYVTCLTPILQCQNERDGEICRHIFAPTELVVKMHQKVLAGIKESD